MGMRDDAEPSERDRFRQSRQANLCLSVLALLFGIAVLNFAIGYLDSPTPMQWVWNWPELQPVLNGVRALIQLCSEAFRNVLLIQVLIWRIWKPYQRQAHVLGRGHGNSLRQSTRGHAATRAAFDRALGRISDRSIGGLGGIDVFDACLGFSTLGVCWVPAP